MTLEEVKAMPEFRVLPKHLQGTALRMARAEINRRGFRKFREETTRKMLVPEKVEPFVQKPAVTETEQAPAGFWEDVGKSVSGETRPAVVAEDTGIPLPGPVTPEEQQLEFYRKSAGPKPEETMWMAKELQYEDYARKLIRGTPDTFMDKLKDVGKHPEQLVPFLSSGINAYNMAKLLYAGQSYNNNTATPEQIQLLINYANETATDKTFGNNVMSVLAAMPSFGGELLATSGIFNLVKTGVFEGGKEILEKIAKRQITSKALELTLKSAGGIAGATVESGIIGTIRAVPEAMAMLAPGIELDKFNRNQLLNVYANTEPIVPTLVKAWGNQWIEILSERSGGLFSKLAEPARNLALKSAIFNQFVKLNPGSNAYQFNKILGKMGWNGIIGEMMEERAGEVGRAVFLGEPYKLPTPEQLATELVAFSIPAVGQIAMTGGMNALARQKEIIEGGKKLAEGEPEVIDLEERPELKEGDITEIKGVPEQVKAVSPVQTKTKPVMEGQVKPEQTTEEKSAIQETPKPVPVQKERVIEKPIPEVPAPPIEKPKKTKAVKFINIKDVSEDERKDAEATFENYEINNASMMLDVLSDERSHGDEYMASTAEKYRKAIPLEVRGKIKEQDDLIRLYATISREANKARSEEEGGAQAFQKTGEPTLESKPLEGQGAIINRRMIVRELARKLRVPVKEGGVKGKGLQGASGIFKPSTRTIRIKDDYLRTATHEVGHYLDDTDPAVRGLIRKHSDELSRLDYDKEKKRANEGFAELLRMYITQETPERIKDLEASRALEKYINENQEVGEVLNKARDDYKAWVDMPDAMKVRGTIDFGDRKKAVDLKTGLKKIYTNVWDDLAPIRDFVRMAGKLGIKTLEKDDPYVLARLLKGGWGKAQAWLENETDSGKAPLKEILKPVAEQEQYRWFSTYLKARRIADFARRRVTSANISADAQTEVSLAEKNIRAKGLERNELEKQLKDAKGQMQWVREFTKNNPERMKVEREIAGLVAKIRGVNKELRDNYKTIREKEPLIGKETDIKDQIQYNQAVQTVKDLDNKYPQFRQTAQNLYGYQDELMSLLVQNGLMDRDTLARIRKESRDYVPFYRVMDELSRGGFMGKSLADVKNPVKKIIGSEKDTIDPLESVLKNTYTIINAVQRNEVARKLADLADSNPMLGQVLERVDTGSVKGEQHEGMVQTLGNIPELKDIMTDTKVRDGILNIFSPQTYDPDATTMTVMRNGKPEVYQVNDKELYSAIKAMSPAQMGFLMKALAVPARFQRAAFTGINPEFFSKNLIRDQFEAFINSEAGYVPFISAIRGLFSYLKKDRMYWEWTKTGGQGANLVSMDRDYLKQNMKDLLETGFQKAVKNLNPITLLRNFSEFSENSTRLGEYILARKKGMSPEKAGFSARNLTLDFQKQGLSARAMNQIIPFLSANLNGLARPIEQFKKYPGKFLLKTMMGITLPTIALWIANKDDDRYKEIPNWQKAAYWIFFIGDKQYRIPKPQQIGVLFGTVIEDILSFIDEKDPATIKKLEKDLLQTVNVPIIPGAVTPLIEVATDYSFFKKGRIEGSAMKRLLPEDRYGIYTSETAKSLGKILGASPTMIDHLVQGYSGGLGKLVLDMVDFAQRGEWRRLPTRMEDIPILRGFAVRKPVGNYSQSLIDFYDNYEKIEQAYNSAQKAKASGNMAGARKIVAKYPVRYYSAAKEINKEIQERNKEIKAILTSDATPERKLAAIEGHGKIQTRLASRFNAMLGGRK